MHIDDILRAAVKVGASDVHLKVGSHPVFRIEGSLFFIKEAPVITEEFMQRTAFSMMSALQRERFKQSNDVDLAYNLPGVSRFRVNIFQQRGALSMALRVIPSVIRDFRSLNLPPIIEKIAQEERGLVLVTGTTGSGKTTTLASIIDYINSTRVKHIITIEDPIEYVHVDKKSYINQRELGIDTFSFSSALRAALREDPDVILVGEMRDLETIEIAISAAETGHLVFSTLHTLDAKETVNRILAVFPSNQQNQIRYQLSQVLKAIVSLRLVPRSDGKGRVPAVEVLIATARIRDCIANPSKTDEIRSAIEEGNLHYGMQTFDQSLFDLYQRGLITYEEALAQATNKDDLALKIKGVTPGSVSVSESRVDFELETDTKKYLKN
jgi:twitching motility protein PilT